MKKIYVAISSIALLFIIGCGGGGNNDVKGVSGDNSSVNSNASGGETPGAADPTDPKKDNETEGNSTEGGTDGSWLDYFPKYDDAGLTTASSYSTEYMSNVTPAEYDILKSRLTDSGFSGMSNDFYKQEQDSEGYAIYSAHVNANAVYLSDPKVADYLLINFMLEYNNGTIATEDMLHGMFGQVNGDVTSRGFAKHYTTLPDHTEYVSDLQEAGFDCSFLGGKWTCKICEADSNTIYQWDGEEYGQLFSAWPVEDCSNY